ncbi:MAG: 1-(5-phosphoribosyl)-5-[(5-phosphoribosylamino)methylideneamino] imidazole-4-carboxamide isomerase [Euryarchaeota archaeon]|nr:1-(5-phosphoribosyl)-5-[(5-phosphoribosylamino)methylideneamino] imidazole-4-carboxamide isomerase [Euryarchaeota archaeon]
MKVYPAIDLREGATVQLVGGDPDKEPVRHEDPLAVAIKWAEKGAGLFHIVDLDAALGTGSNLWVVDRILRTLPQPVQLGGGVRSLVDIQKRIDMGVGRVIIGTQGIKHPDWLAEACRVFPDRLVLAIDARGDDVAISGWQEASGLKVETVLSRVEEMPLAAVLYTNIDIEGGMAGVDASAVDNVVRHSAHKVIASGGIATLEDLDTLASLGVDAAVLGMSIYTDRIDLKEAIERVEGRKVEVSGRHVLIPKPAVQWGGVPEGTPDHRVIGGIDGEEGFEEEDLDEPDDGLVYHDPDLEREEARPRPRPDGGLWGRRRRQDDDDEEVET